MSIDEVPLGAARTRPHAHGRTAGHDAVTGGAVSRGAVADGATSDGAASDGAASDGAVGATAALAVLTSAVEALAVASDPTVPGGRLPGAAAVDVVREALVLAGRLSAIAARVVPGVEADGWWALDGARSITTWVAAQGRLSHGQAARLVTLGRAFRDDLPATATDAVAGVVPLEAAHAIAAAANTALRREALTGPVEECGEGFLLAYARELPVSQFRMLTRRWAAQADPGADDRGHKEATGREFFTLAQTTDGCHLAGFLTTEHGHALAAALTSLTGRSADQAGQPASRRRAGALMNLTRLVLDRDLTGATGTHRPHISAVVDYDTLHRALARAGGRTDPVPASPTVTGAESLAGHRGAALPAPGPGLETARPDALAGVATSRDAATRDAATRDATARNGVPAGTERPDPANDPSTGSRGAALPTRRSAPGPDTARFAVADLVGTGPIPDTVLARLACDSAITRIVFGPDSQILNVGRTERTYTGPKRRAIIARDHHCQYPGCDAPPALSEIHHTQHWHRDHGTTDTHTGILLCWHHHETVHDRGIEITRDPHGRWTFTDRHGQPLRT